MKSLVIAEKPSVARDIARVLHCGKKGNGMLEGDRYIVTWALGHLVTLADPEEYDRKYEKWEMGTLPMLPEYMRLVVIRQTAKQFGAVKTQLYRKDVDQVIIATDAGREGELVARWILDKTGCTKPIRRLWISSVTDKAIKEGFSSLKDGHDYDYLYQAAAARAEADWLVGINGTRALTCKYNAQLSCGRVQTPTLAMIAQREEEIKEFVPKEYYGLTLTAGNIRWTWKDSKSGSFRSFQQERLVKLAKEVANTSLQVVSVEKKAKKTMAPGLYDLTTLQREANQKFGFSAKETLNIMQRLYENHKVLTYPRTDSRYIGKDIVPTLKERLKACGTGPYRKLAGALLTRPIQASTSFVDDKKVSDHHAIIPTEERVFISNLSEKERKIFDLVVKRFLSVLCPPFEYTETKVKGNVEGEIFVAKGNKINSLGWKETYKDLDDEETYESMPNISKNSILKIDDIKVKVGKTNPPTYLNEATLLTAMEKNNLGTVATRADIIEKLFNSFLIEQKGKDILITSKGKQLLDLVPTELRTPELTSSWEKKLQDISKGKLNKNIFIKEMKDYSKDIVKEIKNSDSKFKHDNLTKNRCPECGKYMLEVKGKRGKMLVCEDRECNTRKTVSQITNSRCPVCHKKLELRGEGEAKTFICSCGHREKLSAYNKRKQEDKNKASKKDINKYLKSQNKDVENFNNPFAQALAKLKK